MLNNSDRVQIGILQKVKKSNNIPHTVIVTKRVTFLQTRMRTTYGMRSRTLDNPLFTK